MSSLLGPENMMFLLETWANRRRTVGSDAAMMPRFCSKLDFCVSVFTRDGR